MSYIDRSKTRPGTTRRVRMLGHDYTYPGYYFITICTQDRQQLFGQILRGEIEYSAAGKMVIEVLHVIPTRFEFVSVDCYVVMPNHLHILLGMSVHMEDEQGDDSVNDVVRWLKNSTVRRFGSGVRENGWQPYDGRLWQKGFHDHIVRNDKELETLRNYIANNVYMWEKDTFYDG